MNLKKHVQPCLAFLFFSAFGFAGQAQTKTTDNYSREFSFKTENDAYLFNLDDAYYTNGFMLNYNFAKTTGNSKKIHTFELGQKIFTPLIRTTVTPADIDRAYSGYLYVSYGQTRFLKNDGLFQFTGSLGVTGPASGGEGLQNTYHGWLKYAKFAGWKYQIENSIGLDAGITYAKTIAGNDHIKIVPVAQLNLGTTFTNAKMGAIVVLGAFEKNSESALWNARVSQTPTDRKRNHEFFAYWHPQLIVQGYNATLQGGVFNNGTSEVTQDPSTFMFQQTIGVCFAQGRFTGRLEYVQQSKETPAQSLAHRYGVIQVAYRIH